MDSEFNSRRKRGENMTNTKLLQRAIEVSGYKRDWLAKKLNISRAALLKKINNESEFKASEVSKLSQLLSLTAPQRDNIFLS